MRVSAAQQGEIDEGVIAGDEYSGHAERGEKIKNRAHNLSNFINQQKEKGTSEIRLCLFEVGVAERTRTSTGLPPPAPQAGASAISPLRQLKLTT